MKGADSTRNLREISVAGISLLFSTAVTVLSIFFDWANAWGVGISGFAYYAWVPALILMFLSFNYIMTRHANKRVHYAAGVGCILFTLYLAFHKFSNEFSGDMFSYRINLIEVGLYLFVLGVAGFLISTYVLEE